MGSPGIDGEKRGGALNASTGLLLHRDQLEAFEYLSKVFRSF